jgi:ActR/RegA family two-component response regulator
MLNRRRHPRAAAPFLGAVDDIDVTALGLSQSGACIDGVDAMVGERLRVRIDLPGGPVKLLADVLRRDDDGCVGVAFVDVHPAIEALVHSAVLDTLTGVNAARAAVLIVDDSRIVCHALRKELAWMGKVASVAHSAKDAIARIEDPDQDIEVAIVDAYLGDIEGTDLVAFLAAEYPDVRRVLMSGCVAGTALAHAAEGCHAFVEKPWHKRELATALGVMDGVTDP